METTKVSIREFRSDLGEYIASHNRLPSRDTVRRWVISSPPTGRLRQIWQHSRPTRPGHSYRRGVDVESVVADFKARRKVSATAKIKSQSSMWQGHRAGREHSDSRCAGSRVRELLYEHAPLVKFFAPDVAYNDARSTCLRY